MRGATSRQPRATPAGGSASDALGPIGSNTRWLERAVASGQTRGRSPNSRRYDAAPGTFDLRAERGEIQRTDRGFAVGEGGGLGAFGLTEPEAGSDAGNTKTRARVEDGEWVIDGAKQFITNAGTDISGLVTITARTGDDEISNLIVPAGTPGYDVGEPYRKMGWNASDTRPLSFDGCRVPENNLLGSRGEGFKQFLQTLDGGRIGVAAMGVGLAQGALDEALAYAKERRAFGQPISRFQAIQSKLADISTEIEAARLITYKAAKLKDEGRPFSLTAAQAKLKTGRLAVRATEEAVQIHGGYGYIEEYPVCRFYRDAKILTIGEGTDEVQQMVIARALGA